MSKTNEIVLGIIVLIIVAGGSFYGGTIYSKGQVITPSATLGAGFAGRGGRTGGPSGYPGAGFTTGTVISNDSNNGVTSITIQLPSSTGGSKIVYYSGATQISKTTVAMPNDLVSGTAVNITGAANSDGSLTAQSIQIRPAGQNVIK